MNIENFMCKDLHGYITKDLSFNKDFTFIHGINGTGKTSLLKALQAATLPDLEWLYLNDFNEISVKIRHERKKVVIRIRKNGETIDISIRISPSRNFESESISLSQVEMAIKSSRRMSENESEMQELIRERIFSAFKDSQIVRQIQKIPTPTFLGLDRTSYTEQISDRIIQERRLRRVNPRISAQDNDLGQGLQQARELIRSHAGQINSKRSDLIDKLRNEIAFSLFSNKRPAQKRRQLPNEEDIKEYVNMRDSLRKTLTMARYDETYIASKVVPFFESIIVNANYLKQFTDINDAYNKSNKSDVSKLFTWLEMQPLLEAIYTYFHAIEDFNKKETILQSTMKKFEDIMKNFFLESGKKVNLSPAGEILISSGGKNIHLPNLSSGEKQILVLMTHLIFNTQLQEENVLIIDEPELSLHVRWQEIFVDAVRDANPRTQMILATHAPSIILDRKDKMISLDHA